MAGKKTITNLSELTSAASNDVLPVVDVSDQSVTSSGETKKITVTNLLSGKADSSHTHAISDVTNLQTSLDAKQATVTAGDGLSFSGDTLNAEVTQSELDAKQDTVTAGDGLSFTGSTLNAEVTQTELDAKQAAPAEGAFVDGDKTKLDGIETGATADQSDSEIKTAYENNADTNAFTDADHTKLDGIESGATADQTASEIKTAYESNSDTNAFTDADHTKLDSIESNATADQTASEIKTAYESNSDTNAFTDADYTKLDGIATGAIANVSEDTTPQLGGNLDVGSNEINTSTTNGNIALNPDGTGYVEVKGDGTTSGTAGAIMLNCSYNTHGVKIQSPAHSASADYTLTLPVDNGDSGEVLSTDGNGVLSWATRSSVSDLNDLSDVNAGSPSDGQVLKWDSNNSEWKPMPDNNSGGSGGSASAAGSTGYLQFNDGSNNFDASSNLVWDDTNNRLGVGVSSPSVDLHISKASNPTLRLTDTTNNNHVYLQQQDSHAYLFTGQDQKLTLGTNNNNHLTISTGSEAGFIGIGTTSPSSIVHASKSAGVNFQANSRAFFGSLYSNHFAVVGGAAKADDSTTSQMVSTETASSGNGLPSAIKLGAGNIDFHTAASSTAGAAFDSLRMRIDSSGNVGIGTTSPSEKLEIYQGNIKLGTDTNTTNKLIFERSGADRAEIYVGSGNQLQFDVAGTERMRIDSSGNCAIGHSSPDTILHTLTDSDFVAKFESTDGYAAIILEDGGTSGSTHNGNRVGVTGNDMHFTTGGTERLRIDSSGDLTVKGGRLYVQESDLGNTAVAITRDADEGYVQLFSGGTQTAELRGNGNSYFNGGNVGIGTTNPSSPNSVSKCLHIHDSAHCSLVMSDDSNTWEIVSNLGLTFRDGTDTRMTIDSSGRVGIGTGSSGPQVSLHIASASPVIKLEDTDATGTPECDISGAGGDLILRADKDNEKSNSLIGFEVDGTERMRIDSSGDVGVNTTGPNLGSWGKALTINSNSTASSCSLELAQGGTLYGFVGVQGSGSSNALDIAAYQSQDIRFRVGASGGTQAMVIDSSGNVKIGDATTDLTSKLTVSGNGSVDTGLFMYDGGAGTYLAIETGAADGVVNLKADARSGAYPPLTFETGGNERMRIQSDGTVHLPSSSNNTLLKIDGNSATTKGIRIQSENAGGVIYAANPSIAALRFGVTADDSSITTGLAIDNQARVAIGSGHTSPSFNSGGGLHIKDTSRANLKIETGSSACEQFVDGNDFYLDHYPSGSIVFRNNTRTERLRIDSSGYLNLQNDYNIQYFNKANGTDRLGWVLNRDNGTCQYMWADGQPLMFGTVTTGGTATELMRIDSSGRVGIGTDSSGPQTSLHVVDATDPVIRVQNTSANPVNGGAIHFAEAAGPDGFKIQHDGNNNRLNFEYVTSSTESTFFTLQRNSGRVTVKKSSNAAAQSVTIASNAASIDLDAGNNFEVSIPSSGSTNIETSSSSGLTVGQSGVIRLAQGGGATTFSTIFKWQSGTTPTPSTSGVDLIAYYVDSSTTVSATYLTNVS